MSGLKWIRIDTAMFDNLKFLHLKDDRAYKAIVLHLEGMTYSGRHGYDGFIPQSALRLLGGAVRDAERLQRVNLWLPSPGGWTVNDWDSYQLSNDEVKQRTERAREAAVTRWKRRNEADDW